MKNFNLAVPLGTVSICYLALAVGFTSSAQAARIDFGDNPIDFIDPKKDVAGPGIVTTQGPENKKKLENGYQIIGLTYTVQRKGAGDIMVYWKSSRQFNHGAMGDALVRISGETKVTVTRGTAKLFVQGIIDNNSIILVRKNISSTAEGDINWKESGTKKNLAIGNHDLVINSGIIWEGGNDGDTVTVSSLYEVTATVPEPSSIIGLAALGTLGAASTLKRKLKPPKSTEKETTKVG